jgi:hypothetical protein
MRYPHSSQSAAVLLLLTAGYAVAQRVEPLPENTIKCESFKRQPNGWFVGPPTTFDVGSTKALTISNQLIGPGFMNTGGGDLYEVIERKCRGPRK